MKQKAVDSGRRSTERWKVMTTNDSAIVMKGDLRELKELVELLAGAGIGAEILKPDACRLNT